MNKKKIRNTKKAAYRKKSSVSEEGLELNSHEVENANNINFSNELLDQYTTFINARGIASGYSQDELAELESIVPEVLQTFFAVRDLSSRDFDAILAGKYENSEEWNHQKESGTIFTKIFELIFPKPVTQFSDQSKLVVLNTVYSAFNCANGITMQNQPLQIDCKKNCSWCCSLQVALSIPEVLLIKKYLIESLPADELKNLKSKLSETADSIKNMSEVKRNNSGIYCPLLVDNKCSIYQIRPLTCRGYNSKDKAVCEKNYMNYGKVPHNISYKELIFMVYYGLCEGAKESGLQEAPVELISALDFALQTENIESQWLSGKKVFPSRVVINFS